MALLMKLLKRATTPSRTTYRDPAEWFVHALTGGPTTSGERVSPENAVGASAWYACMRAISEDVGKLDLILYRRTEEGKERAAEHPLYTTLHDSPNGFMTAMTFRETLTHWALGWGNGYAEIEWNDGRVQALLPIHPRDVQIEVTPQHTVTYIVTKQNGGWERIDPFRMFHLHGLGDGYSGYSVAHIARESIGGALAAQRFGAAFYGNGAHVGGVLQHPGSLKDKAIEHLRDSVKAIHSGAVNAQKMLILEEGMKYERLSVPPEDAQFIETRQHHVEELARWFRMPPHKIQHLLRATFSNIEHQSIEYLTDTLLPWLKRWEQEINRKLLLFDRDRDFFAEHLVESMLRGDNKSRNESYRIAIEGGWINRNEVRRRENMNPIEGLDDFMMPLNFQIVSERQEHGALPTPASESFSEASARELCHKIANSHEPLLKDRYRSLLNTEQGKALRALKKGRLDEWSRTFWEGATDHIRAALLPVVDAYTQAVWAGLGNGAPPDDSIHAIGEHLDGMIARHCGKSKRDIQSIDPAARIATWNEIRAIDVAKSEMSRLVSLMIGLILKK